MSRVRFAFICDQCGERGEEYVVFPACNVCGKDICKDCCYDFTEQDGEIRWCICHECHDDETYIPATALEAYQKVVSAQSYALYVRGDLEAFKAMNPARWELVTAGGMDESADKVYARQWMDYAAQLKGVTK